jgi:hypothetical protein
MSALGQKRRLRPMLRTPECPVFSKSGHCLEAVPTYASRQSGHKRARLSAICTRVAPPIVRLQPTADAVGTMNFSIKNNSLQKPVQPMSAAPLDGTPIRLFISAGSAVASFWTEERSQKTFGAGCYRAGWYLLDDDTIELDDPFGWEPLVHRHACFENDTVSPTICWP